MILPSQIALRRALALGWLLLAGAAQPAAAQAPTAPAPQEAGATPAWAAEGVVYELNVRTFSREGTFNAVTARLAELKGLGVTVVWLMPIHPIGEELKKGSIGSPYAVRDFRAVNPAYGTPADFRRLVHEAHRQGLRVIIDLVANHTSWDNALLQRAGFHRRDAQGQALSPYDWSDVAQLDYAFPGTRAYMHETMELWVRDFDIDGFRADVAGLVPTDFWEEARRRLTRVKPDIFLLAEAHEPALLRTAFDADYAWPMYHALKDALIGQRPASAVRAAWEEEQRQFPRGALHLRFSDNHDERRAIGFFGERGALAASAFVFTADGIPLLYNGQEVGDVTESMAPALFEKLDVYWGVRERRPEFPALYAWLIPLRRDHSALRRGAMTWIPNANDGEVLTFLRHDASEEILVAINLANRRVHTTVELSGDGFRELRPNGEITAAGIPAIHLDPYGFRLFRRSRTLPPQ
jgi:cyclomaltodextrinase